MKKLLLLFAFAGLAYLPGNATHLMGGQITSRNIGGLTYEVTLTAYRDTNGIPMYTVTNFNYDDGATWSQVDSVPASGPTSIGNGVEMYTYTDTITFPAGGTFNIWMEDCCRNCAINNLTNPCGESFHLNSTIWADPTNSSPVFLNAPITVAQLGVPFLYNPLPFDADNDSISWDLDWPLSMNGDSVVGFVLPHSDPLVPFTIDPVTGIVSFLPDSVGNYVVSIKVHEYRGGVEIGIIRRDMQILVVPSVNGPVIVTTSGNLAPYSGLDYQIPVGSAFTFHLYTSDPDNNQVSVIATGEPFMLQDNPAAFDNAGGNNVVAWTPTASQQRSQPYIMNLRVGDPFAGNIFFTDYTVVLRVGAATGISHVDADASSLSVYPNPVTSELNIAYTLQSEGTVTLEVTNLAGQLVKTYSNVSSAKGSHLVKITNPELNTGIYMLSLKQGGKQLQTTRLSVK